MAIEEFAECYSRHVETTIDAVIDDLIALGPDAIRQVVEWNRGLRDADRALMLATANIAAAVIVAILAKLLGLRVAFSFVGLLAGVSWALLIRRFLAHAEHHGVLRGSGEELEVGLRYGVVEQLVADIPEPLPERLIQAAADAEADTLDELATVYQRPIEEFLRSNQERGWAPDERLLGGTRVNVPDPVSRPWSRHGCRRLSSPLGRPAQRCPRSRDTSSRSPGPTSCRCCRSPRPRPTPSGYCWFPGVGRGPHRDHPPGPGRQRRAPAGVGLRRLRTDLEPADAVAVPTTLWLRGPADHPQLHP